ncbi:MAG: trypsin, partial [Syntrophorhabdus sp.]
RVLTLPKNGNYSRSIIIATDGYVMVEEEVFDLIRKHLNDANIFAFGIGTSVNRQIIEGMAHVGMGEPFVITKPADAPAQAARFREMIESPVLTKVKVSFQGFSAYDVEPPAIPDVLSDRPVIIFGKWKGNPRGTISVSGISGKGKFEESIDVASAKPSKDNLALRYLWARHRITLLSDYNKLRSTDKRVKEVTDLGLTYNLLTAYTSFVAVDSQVRNAKGDSTTVNQPLPLPEGVSDYAVGGSMNLAMMPPAPSQYGMPSTAKNELYIRHQYNPEDSGKRKSDGRAAASSAQVSLGDVSVSGGITVKSATATIKTGFSTIRSCLAGCTDIMNYVITITVNADGTVKRVTIKSKEPKNDSLERCIKKSISALQFTPATDGKEFTITAAIDVK